MPDTERNLILDQQQIRTLEAEQHYFEARTHAQELASLDFEKTQRENAAAPDEARVYSFYTGVDDSSCLQAMATLGYWARQHRPEDDVEFTLEITSGGGSVIDGFALIDTIRDLQSQGYIINTVAKGWVASMGAVLFQAGTKRIIGRRAYLLIHEAQAQVSGSLSDIDDKKKFTDEMSEQIFALLAERSTLTAADIKAKCKRREWYMNATEALQLGFADALLNEAAYDGALYDPEPAA